MRLLDRYLLRELLIPFGYCLVGFSIFLISFDLLSDLSDFQKRSLQVIDVIEYYIVKLPELFVLIIPITFLLALLYALTNHARYHELTAIRAAGISLMRLSMPYFSVGFALSLVLLICNEFYVPQSVDATEAILARYQTNQVSAASQDWELNVGFTNTREDRTWVLQAFNKETGEMVSPHVGWILPDGSRIEILADRGAYVNEQWFFTNVQEFVYPPGLGSLPIPTRSDSKIVPELSETPEEIRIQIKIGRIKSFKQARSAQLSVREILLYKHLHPEDHGKDTLLHGRLAAPWTCLVVVLIALPFGAASGRRNVFVGVASSILICFVYFVCQQLSLALGYGGHVPAWLAGWFPNLLFATAGLWMVFRVR